LPTDACEFIPEPLQSLMDRQNPENHELIKVFDSRSKMIDLSKIDEAVDSLPKQQLEKLPKEFTEFQKVIIFILVRSWRNNKMFV